MRVRVIAVPVALAVLCMLSPGAAGAKKKDKSPTTGEKKEDVQGLTVAGLDPHAFADGAELLPERSVTVSPQRTGALLSELAVRAGKNELPESKSSRVREILVTLEGARLSGADVATLRRIARQAGKSIGGAAASEPAQKAFAAGNLAYEKGSLEEAVRRYAEALRAAPGHLDARNNLALAEIHSRHNAVAVFHLQALMEAAPKYAGAGINLTVALERLGASREAYATAHSVVGDNPLLPMALYNQAWLENAAGEYTLADTSLFRVMNEFDGYNRAKVLRALNTIESGKEISDDDRAALPPDQIALLAGKVSTEVVVPSAGAALFDGETAVAVLPGGPHVVSGSRGEFTAFYWTTDGAKRRLWARTGDLTPGATPVVSADSPSAKTASTASAPPDFIGSWGERWGDVKAVANIQIRWLDDKPKVALTGGWRVSDEKFENGLLSFRVSGGSADSEFIYTVKPMARDWMQLKVLRVQDQRVFDGELTR